MEFISEKYRPVAIGTDVKNTPYLVKKIASSFGVKVVAPKEDLTHKEKAELVEIYSTYMNKHEFDALASAVYAFNEIKGIYERIKDKVRKKNLNAGEILHKVINENLSIDVVLKEMNRKEVEEKKEIKRVKKVTKKDLEKQLERLRNELKIKDERIKNLEEYVEKLKEKGIKRIFRLRDYRDIVKIKKLENEISLMRKKIENYKKAMDLIFRGFVPVEKIKSGEEAIRTKSRIIFLEDLKIEEISDTVEFVISNRDIENVPIVRPEEIEYLDFEDFILIKREEIDEIRKKMEKRFSKWLENYKRSRKNIKNYEI